LKLLVAMQRLVLDSLAQHAQRGSLVAERGVSLRDLLEFPASWQIRPFQGFD